MRIMVLPIAALITLCGCTDQAEVERQAVAAIQGLQGTEIMGYPLTLVEALPMQK